MSTLSEITRLLTARNSIRNLLVEFGIVTATDKLDAIATKMGTALTNLGAITAEVKEGETYNIPKGYHNGSGTVKGVAGGGSYSLQTKTVTPTLNELSITSDDGYYGLSAVTVAAIPSQFQDVSGTTAIAANVLATKVYTAADGTITTGTMTNNGAVSQTLSTATTSYTVPTGYHNGSGKVSITLEEKSATPTASTQNITPSTGKVLSKVTVNPIPTTYGNAANATAGAADIRDGEYAVLLVGGVATLVQGTMTEYSGVHQTLTPASTSWDIPEGYYVSGSNVAVDAEALTATPTTSQLVIKSASASKFLTLVTVEPIPSNYVNSSSVDATAANVLAGTYAVVKDGTSKVVSEGTMTNNGAVRATIDGLTEVTYNVPAGYHNGSGTVNLTSDIETALAAI